MNVGVERDIAEVGPVRHHLHHLALELEGQPVHQVSTHRLTTTTEDLELGAIDHG